ncbi:MAG: winged helix-turn-helix domain-containing protein [Nanoarchaeota archaeon]|nr:winged helix-turn-helix domain-containing protein [Nanoarchaeota archaeon]MBU4493364.1 winged helix-turn-helix domain-containing protein [Nanoarchaeota archaeon]
MRYIHQRITIVRHSKPLKKNINEELQWFGSSLGLFNLRDRNSSCFRIFIELVKSSRKKKLLSSDELAYKTGLSRGTIIHHLNKLIGSGIVVNEKNKYILRVDNLKVLVDEIEKDINRTCSDLKEIAKNIDEELGL